MMTLLKKMQLSVAILGAVLAIGMPDPAAAQSMSSDDGVAVMNESLHELRVFAYAPDAEEGERSLLGWVGHDELEFYTVPDEVKASGMYRIGVQEITPQPQIGVSAEANPVYSSNVLSPEPGETVRITVSEDMDLSEVVVR
jgi:hypothetical protein